MGDDNLYSQLLFCNLQCCAGATGGYNLWNTPGSYSITIPSNVSSITGTAIGGDGDGGNTTTVTVTSNTVTVTVPARTPTLSLRWSYNNICVIDESADGHLPESDYFVGVEGYYPNHIDWDSLVVYHDALGNDLPIDLTKIKWYRTQGNYSWGDTIPQPAINLRNTEEHNFYAIHYEQLADNNGNDEIDYDDDLCVTSPFHVSLDIVPHPEATLTFTASNNINVSDVAELTINGISAKYDCSITAPFSIREAVRTKPIVVVESGGPDGNNGSLIVPQGSSTYVAFTLYSQGVGADNATSITT